MDLKHHRPSPDAKPMRPENRRRLSVELARRYDLLLAKGYSQEEAEYLAEKQILPRFFITPATDLRKEREIALLKEVVLQEISDVYSTKRVLRKYNIPRSQFTYWLEKDLAFRNAFLEVEMDWGDDLEEAAFTRAISGGSDSLLAMLLKGHRKRYRPETPNISASASSTSDAGAISGMNEGTANALTSAKVSLQKKLESMALAQSTSQQMSIGQSNKPQLESGE